MYSLWCLSVLSMVSLVSLCTLYVLSMPQVLILGSVASLWYLLEFSEPFPVRAPPALVYGLVTAVPALTVRGTCGAGGGLGVTWGSLVGQGAPLRRLLRYLGVFSFGLLATAIFALAGQVTTGAPAPHFLSVCRPNYSAPGLFRPPAPPPSALCAGERPLVAAARRAFPCKEAALGAYAGAYAGLYVTLAWRGGGSRLAKPAAALGFAAPPFLLGALRVAEHRNHWGDVVAGFQPTPPCPPQVLCVVGSFQNPGEGGGGSGGGAPPEPPRSCPPRSSAPWRRSASHR
uniref:Phosphatidic acid phosphatase type 2/haloperoxidase domain-containing protein n=1 Tax=Melopsittacus undulatus TaxID=13146 RepID=A0A8V5GWU7_MELUD